MTDQKDYRLYLDARFAELTTLINAHNENVQDKLELIEAQVLKTNNRVTHLEDQRDNYLKTRVDSPMLEKLGAKIDCVDTKVEDIKKKWSDVDFFIKHPNLFLAGIAVTVILLLGVVLENNPFNLFGKKNTTTEQVTVEKKDSI